MLRILSAKSTWELEEKCKDLDIVTIGGLSVSNGQYFIAVLCKSKPAPKKRAAPKKPPAKT